MNMRKRLQRRDPSFVYAAGHKLKRNKKYDFKAILPNGEVLFQGWFVADSNNPVVRALSI